MKPTSFVVRPLRIAGVLTLGACIQVDCVTLPCVAPRALTVTVSSSLSGDALTHAVVQIAGQTSGTVQCSGTPTTCQIAGLPGDYTLTVSVSGFQSATRTVTVTGVERTDECHCPAVETAQISVELMPSYTQTSSSSSSKVSR